MFSTYKCLEVTIVDLGDIIDRIALYQDVLNHNGFIIDGTTGIKPWTTRFSKGNIHMDISSVGWTACVEDEEVMTGTSPQELGDFLKDYEMYNSYVFEEML